MIFVTGDLHGPIDISKLNTKNWPEQKELARDDYLIICGDFGLVWDESAEEFHWRHWLNDKPFTTLFVDGNHENHPLLNMFPVKEWNGGKVHQIMDNIYHLMRGQVFTIEGKKFFTMGGASSHDKEHRTPGLSWWPEEVPNKDEFGEAEKNLEKNDYKVDFVITHCMGTPIQKKVTWYKTDILTDFFDDIEKKMEFTQWYSGHYHTNWELDDKHTVMYDEVRRIV